MSAADKDFVALDFVYCGVRYQQGKLFDAIAPVTVYEDGAKSLGEPGLYSAQKARRIIGGIYRGALFTDGQARGLGQSEWTRERWPDKASVALMQAKSDEAQFKHRTARLEADEKSINLIEQALLPIRQWREECLKRGDVNGAYAIDQAVMRALHRRPTSKEQS